MDDKNRFRVKKRKNKKGIIAVFILAMSLIGIGFGFLHITDMQTVEIKQDDQSLGITRAFVKQPVEQPSTIASNEREDIVHVALFGVDRRSKKETGRSDSIIIATIDYKHNKVKLTSLMRDLYVEVEGHGKTKLNHAYAYGGAELAIKTINQNFGTDIRDYATVDFFALEAIIDAIGGVELAVKDEEVAYVNKHMQETALIQKKEPILIQEAGEQRLNGLQAVSYARIRYVGDGDFERTERQRKVLQEMIEVVKGSSNAEMATLAVKVLPHIETSLSRSDILALAYEYIKQAPFSTEEMRFPQDGKWKGTTQSGAWVMETDNEEMKKTLQSYLYEDIELSSTQPHPQRLLTTHNTPRSKLERIYNE